LPASLKSIFANYTASCIVSGSKFLGKYPAKMQCLYLSTENAEKLDRKRVKGNLQRYETDGFQKEI